MITVDMIMSTRPCVRWPRATVEAALARADCSSWVALVESARADGWRTCSIADMRWMMCQYAARHHRAAALTPWVVALTHRRVAAQRIRWPSAPPTTVAIWDRIERWHGDRGEILEIRSTATAAAIAYTSTTATAAYAATTAATTAATAADDAAADAAAYAADDAAADAAAYAADAAARYEMLRDLARRLDGAIANG